MNVNNEYFITAGVDLKLFDSNLKLIHEYNRSNKENSIKLIIKIQNERIVVASNNDIEIYGIVSNSFQDNSVDLYRIRELKRFLNAHKDSILTLENISGR